jgi:electron transfer flavoprotein alpha subunit
MADILIYSERRDTALELAFKAKEFAGTLGLGVSAAAFGPDSAEVAPELAALGADTVYVSDDPALEGLQTDVVAEALAQVARAAAATCVLVGSTRRGKELASRLAQKLDAGCVTDVSSMAVEDGALVAGRYAFGGNTVARETVTTAVKVFAVMPKAFEIGAPIAGAGAVVAPSLTLTPSAVKVVDRRPKEGESVDLSAANRIASSWPRL